MLHKLHNRRDKSSKEHDGQKDNARNDKAALGHTIFILTSDNQADIARGVLDSSTARTDCYGPALLFGTFLLWLFHRFLCHRAHFSCILRADQILSEILESLYTLIKLGRR